MLCWDSGSAVQARTNARPPARARPRHYAPNQAVAVGRRSGVLFLPRRRPLRLRRARLADGELVCAADHNQESGVACADREGVQGVSGGRVEEGGGEVGEGGEGGDGGLADPALVGWRRAQGWVGDGLFVVVRVGVGNVVSGQPACGPINSEANPRMLEKVSPVQTMFP